MIRLDAHYVDPRLVELYDIENPRGADTDFYVHLAGELGARRIVDLGCGTGLLTRELALPGRQVVGVDPSPAMLAVARRYPGAHRVRWIEGDASVLGRPRADLLVMTGNVVQVFLDDAGWLAALAAIHAALRPGGILAFESRNPLARAWEHWNRAETYAKFDSPNGPMESWLEVFSAAHGRVKMQGYNVFLSSGEMVVVDSELRFRDRDEIENSLKAIGFAVEEEYGDWSRGSLEDDSPTMVFVARR